MVFDVNKVEHDIKLSPQRRTSELLHSILNSIVPYLRFTTEDHEQFDNFKLPTLDYQIYINENKEVVYEYFENPQVSNRMLLHITALSPGSLEDTLVQEGVRRLVNTSTSCPTEIHQEILNRYAQKLVNSGYMVEKTQQFTLFAALSTKG